MVQVDVIADMDALRDEEKLKQLFQALGGDWSEVQQRIASVRKAIEQGKPEMTVNEIAEEIKRVLSDLPQSGNFPQSSRKEITAILRKASPWALIKTTGEEAIPRGQAFSSYQSLKCDLQALGLWIVPKGELEGFCKRIGGHGPKWVQEVIDAYDLAKDEELDEARKFIRKVWLTQRT